MMRPNYPHSPTHANKRSNKPTIHKPCRGRSSQGFSSELKERDIPPGPTPFIKRNKPNIQCGRLTVQAADGGCVDCGSFLEP